MGNFELWMINPDGSGLERITNSDGFDGFPMFSPDGKLLVFASSRGLPPGTRETDLYLARWDEAAPPKYLDNPADRAGLDVGFLADPAREGRGVGTAGLAAAGAWVEGRFAALGLAPAGDAQDGKPGFRQPFRVPLKASAAAGTALELDGKAIAAGDFRPLGFSANVEAKGAIVFAGWGIRAPALRARLGQARRHRAAAQARRPARQSVRRPRGRGDGAAGG